MKKLEADFTSDLPKNGKTYFCHLIYNPNLPNVSLEEAMETGRSPNPQQMFSEKEKLEKADLPEGFELYFDKAYVAEESEYIFEPKKGDFGFCGLLQIFDPNIKQAILLRDNKQFFMPEVEND